MKCRCSKQMVKLPEYIPDWYWCKCCGRLCDVSDLNAIEDTWYEPTLLNNIEGELNEKLKKDLFKDILNVRRIKNYE